MLSEDLESDQRSNRREGSQIRRRRDASKDKK